MQIWPIWDLTQIQIANSWNLINRIQGKKRFFFVSYEHNVNAMR